MSGLLKSGLKSKVKDMSVLGFAFMGDAVFELMVRTWLCTTGTTTARKLHNEAVSYVSAKAQAKVIERIIQHLVDFDTK